LTLTYNSRSEDSALGLGWSITGLSRITRCRKSLAVEEVTERVQYDDSDSFCLDGTKLMLQSGIYGASGAEYGLERADYAKIVSFGRAGYGPAYFRFGPRTVASSSTAQRR
jgi:hypothetical protein